MSTLNQDSAAVIASKVKQRHCEQGKATSLRVKQSNVIASKVKQRHCE
jgi:hypothetical protein